ncbi:unnamed protein product [Cyprideis torosa]|uniref:Metallo-beta-lactamase domain-containing protein n=1 Tax=Cyprideis torosa TaxID=163714 RepID=A0A7R8ZTM2_9CRUS|nr:unnamed protein product [Cyprideis torosa]CAG0898319.1 unnamed protein product [Cyprideis torosa]
MTAAIIDETANKILEEVVLRDGGQWSDEAANDGIYSGVQIQAIDSKFTLVVTIQNGEVFLFDVGEGAQVVLKESSVKMGRITRIFITHLHGDHVFGLPGLLATLSISHESQAQVVHIYGPVGLAAYVRTTLRLTQTFLGISLALYELLPSQLALALEPCNPADPPLMAPETLVQGMEPHASEVEPLKRIACDEDSQCWTLLSTPELKVTAGFLLHKIPSFGYVVKESDAPGRLDAGLAISLGVTPGPDLGRLKNGEAVTTSAGRIDPPPPCSKIMGTPLMIMNAEGPSPLSLTPPPSVPARGPLLNPYHLPLTVLTGPVTLH